MITNNPDLKFVDICEHWRTYEYPDGTSITIKNPVAIDTTTSKSGGHRIVDANNFGHYVPAGWNHLYWASPIDVPVFHF
jgi:hypothetical protein